MNATINQNSQKRSKYLAVSSSKSKILRDSFFPAFRFQVNYLRLGILRQLMFQIESLVGAVFYFPLLSLSSTTSLSPHPHPKSYYCSVLLQLLLEQRLTFNQHQCALIRPFVVFQSAFILSITLIMTSDWGLTFQTLIGL